MLRKQGIQVISINEPLEDTPSGKLLEGIIEVIDEFYSANLSQDVTRGMKENAGRGFCNGGYRYQYYMCGSARRKGRETCPSPVLRTNKVEAFVIDRIKGAILTEENLEELVRLTNEELAYTYTEERERPELLQAQIAEADSRLGKLYDALETGKFKDGELAPRIQALFQKKEELQQAKAEAERVLGYKPVDMADPVVVREYVDDLRGLLDRSSITEQRGFLKSFVDSIEVGNSELKIHYTIPMPPNTASGETVEVIPFVHHGQRRGGRRFLKRGFAPLKLTPSCLIREASPLFDSPLSLAGEREMSFLNGLRPFSSLYEAISGG